MELPGRINEAFTFIKDRTAFKPEIVISLGTGLGEMGQKVNKKHAIPYSEIPNFPVSTVESHKGELILGELSGKNVAVMSGRFHFYEGYTMEQVVFPVRVLKFLGAETFFAVNAAGGLNPHYAPGDIVIIHDHINLLPDHPLRGKNYEEIGLRFPDMTSVYDKQYRTLGMKIARENGISCHEGVYVALSGPSLETPAECRFLRTGGGDVVGMSTVPEVIAARHMGMRIFAMSVCTNICFPEDETRELTIEEVIRVASLAGPQVSTLLSKMISSL